MADKKKNIFAEDHIVNGILASPLAFLMGGPAGVVSTLGAAKALAVLEEIEEEKRQKNRAEHKPYGTPQTAEEILRDIEREEKKKEKAKAIEEEIKEIMKDSTVIEGGYKSGCRWMTVYGTGQAAHLAKNRPGKIEFHKDVYVDKQHLAYFYGVEAEYLQRLKEDLRRYPNVLLYTIKGSMDAKWMHSIDGGKTFIVKYGLYEW